MYTLEYILYSFLSEAQRGPHHTANNWQNLDQNSALLIPS